MKTELFFFVKNEAETGGRPWKKEIGRSRRAAAYPKISSTAGRLEATCFSNRQRNKHSFLYKLMQEND
ncbi:hypothetical protein [Alkalicoccus saliphilus]|jgi:hypothetical protein|uniref:Uncharacterized protein n=1 Tax=Alkalicoccus saliphilus TaxID=200989 RepID=A0A2T4U487_9BACI|nr:hypothetical protein [Alkalicoccus saliphilus]PTL38218.1 hypothetical protein C6Y45_12505 [Alkalicoccus saliphilus]